MTRVDIKNPRVCREWFILQDVPDAISSTIANISGGKKLVSRASAMVYLYFYAKSTCVSFKKVAALL